MLPNPRHTPPLPPQKPAHRPVPLHVPRNLPVPERGVGPRFRPVFRASVPETPVHKHRQLRRAKHEIRLPEERVIPPPAGDFVRPENLNHPQFRGAIPLRADEGHHVAALGFCEDVWH